MSTLGTEAMPDATPDTMRDTGATGGIPVAPGGALGALAAGPGRLQYGPMGLGGDTSAGWVELVAWRDLPNGQASDTMRPQAHGTYAGDVWGDSLTVTFTYLVRGRPDAKLTALQTIEAHTPMDGVERPLVVDDGAGPSLRMARVIGRQVPQDAYFRVGPVQCSVQWLCADPRRYSTAERDRVVKLPRSDGGLTYPLGYPLGYGESAAGGLRLTSDGSVPTPPRLTFVGPLTEPVLTADRWRLGFDINLADGEQLVVDTAAGTALLNDTADRLYTIRTDSDPLERCYLHPGPNSLTLAAVAGDGLLRVNYRDARM